MRFKTHDNLIDLLVGQNLYSSPDVAMRELLQNAEDACHLQRLLDPTFEALIDVRHSVKDGWVEISDNGIGMDEEIFQESFTNIGASKTDSPKLRALMEKAGANRPIGQFGIGVLSCFGVADVVEIRSLADDQPPVSYRIVDRREEFVPLDDHRGERGTTITLRLKDQGPMQAGQVPDSVAKFVRHAKHIWIEDADTGLRDLTKEQWLIEDRSEETRIQSEVLTEGYLALGEGWDNINASLDAQFSLTNGGFLVSEGARDYLPPYMVGVRGEADVKPGGLAILMNREGFARDERWAAFMEDLGAHYRRLAADKLTSWLESGPANSDLPIRRAIQRMVYLILHTPLGELVGPENVQIANQLLPSVLLLHSRSVDLDALITQAKANPPLYVDCTDRQQQSVQRSIKDSGHSLTLTETVNSMGLRAALLRANKFAVARADKHSFQVPVSGRSKTVHVHDFAVLSAYCGNIGLAIQTVEKAPDAHLQIGTSRDAEVVSRFMQLSSNLKIQRVSTMSEAVIADYNGYILNANNPQVQAILAVLPEAVGNPIRKQLIIAYFALASWDTTKAKEIILGLVTDPEFEENARQVTGRHFREFLNERVQRIMGQTESSGA